jgi:mannose-6-phosphate isomerase-like protein (cupin superfamily)
MPALSPITNEDYVANLSEKPSTFGTGFVVALEDQPIEGGFNPVFGDVTWQTLISGEKTISNGLILGVATFPPHGILHLHRHTPPEFYFCLTGSGIVTLDGIEHQIMSGSAIFIPSNVEHGVVAGAEGLTFAYGFGEDAFSAIEYRFSN